MRVLSIDVGIRNLAMCVIDSQTGEIADWRVIDLCESRPSCSYQGRRCVCAKPARFAHDRGFLCRAHATANGRVLRRDVPSVDELKKRTSEELLELAQRYGVPPGNHSHSRIAKETRSCMIKACPVPLAIPDASKMELAELARVLQARLDKDLNLERVDEIIIENQISTVAGRMKCVQAMLTQYFVMRTACPVRFVSASIKLKNVDGTKATYSQRKKLGVEAALKYLESTASLQRDMFRRHDKQDDLADSLLQALAYMERADHIPWMFDSADYLK